MKKPHPETAKVALMSKFYFLLPALFLLIIPHQINAQQSSCGNIIDRFGNNTPYTDCQNPFSAVIDSPTTITLEGQPVTPNSQITIDGLNWGIFDVEEELLYFTALYKKVGSDYVFQKRIPQSVLRGAYDQAALNQLEFKFYHIEMALDTNWSAIWRDFPQYIGTNEYQYIADFEFNYSPNAYRFTAGEYMLVLEEYDIGPPVLNWTDRIFDFFIPTAHAQLTGNTYAIPFSVTMSGSIPALPPTCNLTASTNSIKPGESATLSWNTRYISQATLEPNIEAVFSNDSVDVSPLVTTTYTLQVSGAGGTNECQTTIEVEPLPLAAEAAMWAKTLVNQPDAYLWGGKGWDYDSDEFTDPDKILSGYRYYNASLGRTDFGIGLDCSGLIAWAFNRSFDKTAGFLNNFIKYENADGQFRDYQSDPVTEAELAPGDALFFDQDGDGKMDHVAMYVGESGGYDVVNAGSLETGIEPQSIETYTKFSGFVGYRRLHSGQVGTVIKTGSPVDLKVTDPDGLTISPDTVIDSEEEYIREIPGELYYLENQRGHDGHPSDLVYSPHFKTGTYQIEVIPTPEATATSTYSLTITTPQAEVTLIDNSLVSSIPNEGFTVQVTDTEIVILDEPDLNTIVDEIKNIIATNEFEYWYTKPLLRFQITNFAWIYEQNRPLIAKDVLQRLHRSVHVQTRSIGESNTELLIEKIEALLEMIEV